MVKGFGKGSETEKMFYSYIGQKQPKYVAIKQKDGSYIRTTNGIATSIAKSENQLAKGYEKR